jgi:hypothetical protein
MDPAHSQSMSTEWQAPAQPPPAYHDDPSEGGPPLASPDGHWWWDGSAWVPRPDPVEPAA